MTDPRAADVAVALNDRNAALSERQAAADLPELPHPRDETALDVGAPASGSSSDGPPASPTAPASPNKKKDVNISSSGGVGGITAAIVDILDGHNDPEYSYMDVVDPDLASRDAHLNENQSKLVNTIQFITRGHAVVSFWRLAVSKLVWCPIGFDFADFLLRPSLVSFGLSSRGKLSRL